MMSAMFGREVADGHYQRLAQEAEHDRLVGRLKRERRELRRSEGQSIRSMAAIPRRPAPTVCAQDIG
jgi:hypothetical protein